MLLRAAPQAAVVSDQCPRASGGERRRAAAMPCPLRFVLAGVSAAVLATLFFMGRSDPALEKQKVRGWVFRLACL